MAKTTMADMAKMPKKMPKGMPSKGMSSMMPKAAKKPQKGKRSNAY